MENAPSPAVERDGGGGFRAWSRLELGILCFYCSIYSVAKVLLKSDKLFHITN